MNLIERYLSRRALSLWCPCLDCVMKRAHVSPHVHIVSVGERATDVPVMTESSFGGSRMYRRDREH